MKLFITTLFILLYGDTSKAEQPKGATFLPDTTINNSILLHNSSSVKKNLGDIMPYLNKNKSLPYVVFLNANKAEYLKLIFFPGNSSNSFSYFEIGIIKKPDKTFKKSSYKSFQTESLIKLGINKKELLKIKGNNFEVVKKGDFEVITYVLNDIDKSDFLKRYNMPVYKAEYTFKKDKLIKFSFGFEYP